MALVSILIQLAETGGERWANTGGIQMGNVSYLCRTEDHLTLLALLLVYFGNRRRSHSQAMEKNVR